MKLERVPVLALTLLAFAASALAVSKITRTGRYLYSEDGSRFYIKGVAYQGPAVDTLADADGCARDLPFLKQLGVNAVRVYSADSTLDHDSCMSALSEAGIYLILDLSLPSNGSIDTVNPAWSTNLIDQYIKTINVFSKYDNVLIYNLGNEVVNETETSATPFIKAAARDIKAYLNSISSPVLVGYAAKDVNSSARATLAEYLSCDPSGTNSGATAIDIFGLNNYEWCGTGSPSIYSEVNSLFENYNVAAYFSEFGGEDCNPGTRPWTEVGTLFSSPMTDTWSGGSAFAYFPTTDPADDNRQFGMIQLSPDNKTVTPTPDFNNLVSQYSKVSLANSPAQSSVSATFGTCPAPSTSFEFSTKLPPTPNDVECACIVPKLSCVFNEPPPSTAAPNVGELTGEVCGGFKMFNISGSCNDISANGPAGTYGPVSMCDPITKLSYAYSQYYEGSGRNAGACGWSGSAKLVNATAGTAASAAAACIPNALAVATPTAPVGASSAVTGFPSGTGTGAQLGQSASASSGGGGGGGGTQGSGAVPLLSGQALRGIVVAAACVAGGIMWTLVLA